MNILDPSREELEEQLDAMKQAFSQMTDTERQAFLQYLAQQEAQLSQQSAQFSEEAEQGGEAGPGPGSASGYSDISQWKQKVLYPKVWELMVSTLTPEDAAILRKAFPGSWSGSLSRLEVTQALRRLAQSERERLPLILGHIDRLQQSADLMAQMRQRSVRRAALRRRRMAVQQGIALPEELDAADEELDPDDVFLPLIGLQRPPSLQLRPSEAEAGPSATSGVAGDQVEEAEGEAIPRRAWGSWAEAPKAAQAPPTPSQASTGPSSGGHQYAQDRQQQPGASTSADFTASIGSLPQSVQERLQRMLGTYQHYVEGSGWQQELTRRESAEMRSLIRLHEELSTLAEAVALLSGELSLQQTRALEAAAAATRITPEDVEEQLQSMGEELERVIEARPRLRDPAARAVVRYMETQLVRPDAASGQQQFLCDEDSIARLGQFIVAAQNWEAYRAFLYMYASRHPEMGLEPLMQAAGMSEDEEWWTQLPSLDDAPAAGNGTSTSSDAPAGPQLGVDVAKVEAVAALDVDSLQFLTELEASNYSEETFMKWYFHPVMGARIRSGTFLDPSAMAGGVEPGNKAAAAAAAGNPVALLTSLLKVPQGVGMPDLLREAMAEAMADDMAGVPAPGGGSPVQQENGNGASGMAPGAKERAAWGASWGAVSAAQRRRAPLRK